jgi:hypothetical protein
VPAPDISQEAVRAFIAKWQNTPGGAERANYQLFLTGLCQALGLEEPLAAQAGVLSRYQFEGPVPGGSLNGGSGFIDFYRKGSFVLEAKQSQIPQEKQDQPELFDPVANAPGAASGAKYDTLMRRALRQARNYAVNLPGDHPWPPFLIVCDVGRAFEIYFDWASNGRGYDFFPDRQGYRITIDRLADPGVQALFQDIWADPRARDPRLKAAEVTRDVAKRLAAVSKWLEDTQKIKTHGLSDYERSLAIEETSLFLMRILFCMFAEDVGLLPRDSFKQFLADALEDDRHFETGLRDLWQLMADGTRQPRYSWVVKGDVRFFNGGLFENAKTYTLAKADRGELLEAAKAEWKRVEPAIFGTLLEQALTATERAKLGAHYTPRPYVERLVRATIMEVLEAEWEAAQAEAEVKNEAGGTGEALAVVIAFHKRLCNVRVLDPACGTGNFLYVAMELLLRLEGDVLVLVEQLGGKAHPSVGPEQFYGLELNPRAAVIAELVLWIGWLRWRMANDPDNVPEPVLRKTATINFGGHAGYDAALRHTPTGEPDLDNPMLSDWPEVEFIVGNPPFIGGKDIRRQLGGEYAEALWAANPRVPKSADFVMQWWDRAAHTLAASGSPLIRFGFVTTNSITQTFSRRVIEGYLNSGELSLHMAVPDHPWTKASKDAAAVRIAMTVAQRGGGEGRLVEIVHEEGLATDSPVLEERATAGRINPDLSLGSDVTAVVPLRASEGLASPGVKLHGAGFIVSRREAEMLGLGRREGLEAHIRPYRNGRDLLQRSRDAMVIDLFGMSETDVRQTYPEVYEHLLRTVKPERDINRRDTYRKNWWIFGEPRKDLRPAFQGILRYIATVETARHRIFQFVDASVVPDNKIIVLAFADPFILGVLCASIHQRWTFARCGLIGMASFEAGHVYVKSSCFDPFPFPEVTSEQRKRIGALAEELDATRKAALAEVSGLTMTEIYNWREKLRRGELGDLLDRERASAARAGIVDRIHQQLDEAVAAAYGWPADLPPSEIVARLVALNAERAAEESRGRVRWLRPDYQIPRFGTHNLARI